MVGIAAHDAAEQVVNNVGKLSFFLMHSSAAQLDIPLPALPGIEKGWELMMVDENKASGLFTADRIARDEQRLAVVIRALAEGMSIRSIASSQGCSVNTVMAVKRRFGPELETVKQELGREALDVARLAMERIRDEMQDMPKASLPIILGVMVDKAQILTGGPTVRIQHDHSVGVVDVADYIAALPNVTPQSVGAGKDGGQKAVGGDAAVDNAIDEGLVEVVLDAPVTGDGAQGASESDGSMRDSQSRVLETSSEVSVPIWAENERNVDGKGGAA